jgi:hypothetical protein
VQRGNAREAEQEQRLSELEQQQSTAAGQQSYQNMPPNNQAAYSQQQMAQTASPLPTESQALPAQGSAPDKLTALKTLGELRQSGVLTDAEFEAEKQKILRS